METFSGTPPSLETKVSESTKGRVRQIYGFFKDRLEGISLKVSLSARRLSKLPNLIIDSTGKIKIEEVSKSTKIKSESDVLPTDLDINDVISKSIKFGTERLFLFKGRVLSIHESAESIDDYVGEKNRRENIISAIYKICGESYSENILFEQGRFLVSQFVTGKDFDTLPKDSIEYQYAVQILRERFILDCFLGNLCPNSLDIGKHTLGVDGNLYRTQTNREESGSFINILDRDILKLFDLSESNPIYQDIPPEEVLKQIDGIIHLKFQILGVIKDKIIKSSNGKDHSYYSSLLGTFYNRFESLLNLKKRIIASSNEILVTYISETTRNYLAELDKLEINPPELKKALKRNIVIAEISLKNEQEKFAIKNGITIEELKRDLQENVRQAVEKSSLYRATDVSTLIQVFRDGRFKSQFETQTSGGMLDPQVRSKVENRYFGFPSYETNPESNEFRPIYGYFSDHPDGWITDSSGARASSLLCYGDITVKIKNEVKNRTTLTFCDSLGAENVAPSPFIMPHFLSLGTYDVRGQLSSGDKSSYRKSYTEIQIHGQLKIEDIDEIILQDSSYIAEHGIDTLISEYNSRNPNNQIKLRILKP